jgi:hypothetical protein
MRFKEKEHQSENWVEFDYENFYCSTQFLAFLFFLENFQKNCFTLIKKISKKN